MGVSRNIIDRFLYRKVTCLVVQLDNGPVANYAFEAHTFSANKGSLDLLESTKGEHLAEVSSLELAKDHPWVIAIHGRGVVYHLAQPTTGAADAFVAALNARLPAVKAGDFAGQRSSSVPELYSFARLASLEKLVAYLDNTLELSIQGVNFGLSAVPGLFPLALFVSEPTHLRIGGQKLLIEQGELKELNPNVVLSTTDSLQIGEQAYTSGELLALAAVLPLFADREPVVWNLSDLTQATKNAYRTKWLAKMLGLGSMVLLLLLLAVNSIVYTSLHRKQATLDYQQERFSTQLVQLDSLSSRLNNRRKLLGADAGGSRTFSSFYADRIGASLPSMIQLMELSIFPLVKSDQSTRRTDPPRFEQKLIVIEGQCSEGGPISQWITRLNEQEWVENVVLKNNQLPDFVIEVVVREVN